MSAHVLLILLNPLEKMIRCIYLYHKKNMYKKNKKIFYQTNCRPVNTEQNRINFIAQIYPSYGL